MTFKIAVLTAYASFCVLATHAQDLKKPIGAGIGFEVGSTAGVTRTDYTGMGGLTTWLYLRAGHGSVTATTGLLFLAAVPHTQSAAGIQVPVLIGYKYIFLNDHLFIKMELGESHFTHTFHDGHDATPVPSWNSWGPTLAASAGYQFNAFELSLKDELFPSSGLGIHYYAVRVGFNF